MVDLRNYVQVNINYHEAKPLNRVRDIAVLFTLDETIGSILNGIYASFAEYEFAVDTYNESHGTSLNDTILRKYVKCFFANGGIKLRIIGGFDSSAGEGSADEKKIAWLKAQILLLPAEQIVITSDASASILHEAEISALESKTALIHGESATTIDGYKEKIFISSVADETEWNTDPTDPEFYKPNFVVKVGDPGVEMGCAAYLTQIKVTSPNSVQDYCFTIEDVSMFKSGETNASIIDDNARIVEIGDKHFNADTTLVNEVRNVFGDTVTGLNLVNYFVRIVLTQTLTDRILATLVTKIKFDQTGINKVSGAIVQELNAYKSNGYLNQGFIWTEDDVYYSYNGVDYLICSRNTPFSMGYKFAILPVSSLTPEDRAKHKFPPIVVLLADNMPIRQIVINGDVY